MEFQSFGKMYINSIISDFQIVLKSNGKNLPGVGKD